MLRSENRLPRKDVEFSEKYDKYFDIDLTTRLFSLSGATVIKTMEEAWEMTMFKWELISNYLLPDEEISTCGLCSITLHLCDDCPIGIYTNRFNCEQTPYELYEDVLTSFEETGVNIELIDLDKAIQKQIEFLTKVKEELEKEKPNYKDHKKKIKMSTKLSGR